MAGFAPSGGTPQFGTAEYANKQTVERCKSCGAPIGEVYYHVNGAVACQRCATWAEHNEGRDSHAAFVRGILFGVGGAIAGMILYSTIAIVTGLMIGYVSLAVGYLVGEAMKKGAGGRGGRRYQIAAVALTYAAVSLSAIPITIAVQAKQIKAHQAAQRRASPPPQATPDAAAPEATMPESAPDEAKAETVRLPAPPPRPSFLKSVATLLLIGLASPFLALSNPFSGGIGMLILFVGMRFAWRKMDGVEVNIDGLFVNTPPGKT